MVTADCKLFNLEAELLLHIRSLSKFFLLLCNSSIILLPVPNMQHPKAPFIMSSCIGSFRQDNGVYEILPTVHVMLCSSLATEYICSGNKEGESRSKDGVYL